MSKLLSFPPMAVFSNTIVDHQFTDVRFLSFHSILTSGGFAAKSISVKPAARLKLSVKSRQGDYSERQRFGDSSSSQNAEGSPPRVFVGHSIYKGKAALTIEPRAPEFVALESGAFKLTKEGFLLLQFAPAAGVRQYDWSRKQVFSLSVTEIGKLVSLERLSQPNLLSLILSNQDSLNFC